MWELITQFGVRNVEWSLFLKFSTLIRKGPKTVMVIGLETWSAVTWCRYCVIQFILRQWSLGLWCLMDHPAINWLHFDLLICVYGGCSEVVELQPFLTFP